MIGQTLAIARNTFLEAVRQPIFFVMILAGGIMQAFNVLLSAYSMGYTDSAEVSADDKLLLDMGLATVFVIATLLAALISTAVLSREIENKTVMTVVSKPIGRPLFVIGKYLGSTAAILVAAAILLIFLQFALQQEVMSRASDKFDQPVAVFSLGALALSVAVGVWGNFFYGWVFSSSAVFIMLPATVIGYAVTLMLGKGWEVQEFTTDLKPQVLLASLAMLLALPVLTAVALAASTRLGQVMTIVVCAGVFLLGLLSNYFFGRHAFENDPIAQVESAEPQEDDDADLRDGADVWRLTLDGPPQEPLEPGVSLYYAPNPNGVGMAVPTHEPFQGDPTDPRDTNRPDTPPALVVHSVLADDANEFIYDIVNAGSIGVKRPPETGDHLFLQPSRVNWAARAAWSIVPNLQYFWLVDAVTQAHPIPPRYIGMVAGYSGFQVLGLLSLSVILFQKRDVA